jgi:lipoate-protein ligase A
VAFRSTRRSASDITAYRLPHRVASAAAQMSLDAELLAWAAAAPARLVFRAYAWSRPTLSLGRGEPYPEGWDVAAIDAAGVEVVRRPTGGDAVLHDGELTFSVAASLPGTWRLGPRAFAQRVADALADALRALGLDAVRARAEPGIVSVPEPGPRVCFARTAPGEIRVGGFKVAGIASRFTRGGALCHASVPLTPRHRDVAALRLDGSEDRTALERHARSAAELLGAAIEPGDLADRVASAIAARFEVALEPVPFGAVGALEPAGA